MKSRKYLIYSILFFVFFLSDIINSHNVKAEEDNTLSEQKEQIGLSLQECIVYAAHNSYEVKLARLDFLIAQTGQTAAEAIFDTTISANIEYSKDRLQSLSTFSANKTTTNLYSVEASKKLPTGTKLTLSFSDTRQSTDSAFVSSNPSHSAQAAIEARQPLAQNAFGYVDRRTISATSLAIQNTDLTTQERIESLFAQVEQAYWQWVFFKKNLEVHSDILAKAEELHQRNIKNYDLGIIEKADFLASEANVLIREKDLQIAENQYRDAQENIKLLMNVDTKEKLQPKELLQYRNTEINLDECLKEAFKKRRDYQQVKREIEINQIVLEKKANQRWPEIDLVASMQANGINSRFSDAAERIVQEDNTKYFAGVELTLPIENNLARSEYKKAQHNKEKAILMMKQLERAILTEVGEAFRDFLTYQNNVKKLEKATQLQSEKLKEEEKRFNSGRSSTKRLIDYQQDYLSAQLHLAAGLLDLKIAKVSLEKTLNIILEKYERLL